MTEATWTTRRTHLREMTSCISLEIGEQRRMKSTARKSSVSFADMKMKSFLMILCFLAQLFVGCVRGTSQAGKTETDHDEILTVTLADMVTNADTSGALVRFIDAPKTVVDELRARCGRGYIIDPSSMAERKRQAGDLDFGYYSRATGAEGVLIRIEAIRVSARTAEAFGSFLGRLNGAGFRYSLISAQGGWQVVHVENVGAI
jgi:hypothetical protein